MANTTFKQWLTLIGVSLLAFTAFLDFTIVNTALPAIQSSLRVPVLTLQWVMNLFAIAVVIVMVIGGRAGDRFGRRKIFYIGVLLFIIAAIGAGLSENATSLILFRGLQGLGAGVLFTLGAGLAPSLFPEEKARHAIGIYSAITGLGLAIGPFMGGMLVSLLDWRWVFFINIPFIIIGFLCCGFTLKETETTAAKFDRWGTLLIILGIGGLIYGIIHAEDYGLWQASSLTILIGAIACLIALYFVEKKVKDPALALEVFQHPHLILGILTCIGGAMASYIMLFFNPLYLSSVRHLDAWMVGSLLVAVPVTQVIISLFWSPLSKKFGVDHLILFGFVAGIISCIMQYFFAVDTSYIYVIVAYLLVGATWGLANSGVMTVTFEYSCESKRGGVMGTVFTSWNSMGATALALATVLFKHGEVATLNQAIKTHAISLSSNQLEQIKTLLADPSRVYDLLEKLTPTFAEKALGLFKTAFLAGFQNAMVLSAIVLFACLIYGWYLAKQPDEGIKE